MGINGFWQNLGKKWLFNFLGKMAHRIKNPEAESYCLLSPEHTHAVKFLLQWLKVPSQVDFFLGFLQFGIPDCLPSQRRHS